MSAQPTKREPLPWFAFNIAEYIKDTMRLTTEAHGAYLLLILDYYGTTTPCPDDDFILAAVAKLSPATWKTHRKVLEPFFDIRDGHWFHKRIEREMAEAELKHSSRRAQAVAGGLARWGKTAPEPATTGEKRPNRRQKPPEQAPAHAPAEPAAKPEHMPEQSPGHAHLHLQEDSLSAAGSQVQGNDEQEGIGTPISQSYRPPAELIAEFLPGVDAGTVHLEIQKFIYHHQEKGTFSLDWDATFKTRCIRFQEHHAKTAKPKAAPRVEVNAAIDWDSHVASWVKQKRWPARGRGGEPGMLSCKCPPEILIKHGVDPATGDKLKEPAT